MDLDNPHNENLYTFYLQNEGLQLFLLGLAETLNVVCRGCVAVGSGVSTLPVLTVPPVQ